MEVPGNFSSLKEEMNLQNQGSWVTVTPVKPVPSKMPVVTRGESWLEKAGISSSAAAAGSRYNGSTSFQLDSSRALGNNWEAAMAAPTTNLDLNQQKHVNFMNFTDLASAAGSAQRGENRCYPYPVIPYPQAHVQQPLIHAPQAATLSLQSQKMLLGGMIPCNATAYSQQTPPYGFPVPYNYVYDHNSLPQLVSNGIPSNTSPYQLSPVTQDMSIRAQTHQSTDLRMNGQGNHEKKQGSSLQSIGYLPQFGSVTPEKNVQNERTQNNLSASKLIHFGIEEMVNQEKIQHCSFHSWGSLLQFAPVTPEKNAQSERAQNNQSPSTLIDFSIDENANQEKNQVCPPPSRVIPGNEAIGIFCDQGLSQSSAIHPSQFAPATPAKNAQNNQSPEGLMDFVDERADQEKRQSYSFPSWASPDNQTTKICCDQGISQSLAIPQFQLYEIPEASNGEGEVHVIDLNKTPQQKPKRRKHRPKVIREKKSRKAPKPVTPKKAGTEGNATGRKRSIGKQGRKHSTPLPCVEEPFPVQTGGVHVPLCKRSLNFELETIARDGGLGMPDNHCDKLDSGEDVSNAGNLQIVEGPEVRSQSAGVTFDLNCSASQLLDSFLPLPEKQNLPSPLKRKSPSRENMNMAAKRSNLGTTTIPVVQDNWKTTTYNCIPPAEMRPANILTAPNCYEHELLQKGPGSVTERQFESNISSQPLAGHTKPGVKELNQENGHTAYNTVFHPINQIEANLIPMRTCFDMIQEHQNPRISSNHNQQYPQIYGKEMGNKPKNGTSKDVLDMSSFSTPVTQTHMVQNFPREDQARIGFHKPQGYETMLAFNQMELKRRSKAATRIRNMATFSASRSKQMLVIYPNRTPGYDAKQEQGLSRWSQTNMEVPVAKNRAKMLTKMHAKKASHTVSYAASTPTNQPHAQQDVIVVDDDQKSIVESTSAPLGQKSIRSNASSPRKLQKPNLHILPKNSAHDCQNSSLQGPVAMVPPLDPIDEIVQRLKDLNINRDKETATTQKENALVLYGGNGTMVPYEGPFDPMKKRRSRPKVDLDMETVRQWKLLMGRDSSENLEGTDEEKEKWWEEERRVFKGRADSFIARMHLVQGDRRFSKWKGSVVDSVVGVFLTQNVSDHLSSSAFMSLAARFPVRSKTNNGVPNTDESNIAPAVPDVCVLEFDNKLKWQAKLMTKQLPDQSSVACHEAEQRNKKIVNGSESFGSNILGSNANCSEGTHLAICETGQKMCLESIENGIQISVTATTGANLAEFEDRRSPEDVSFSVVSSQNSTDSTIQIADRIGSSSESNYESEEQMPRCSSHFDSSTFTELLHMAGTHDFRKIYIDETAGMLSEGDFVCSSDQLQSKESEQRKSNVDRLDSLKGSRSFVYPANSHAIHAQYESIEDRRVSFVKHNANPIPAPDLELSFAVSGGTTGLSLPTNISDITEVQYRENADETEVQLKLPSSTQNVSVDNPDANISKPHISLTNNTKSEASAERDSKTCNDSAREMTKALFSNNISRICSDLPVENTICLQSKPGEAGFCSKSIHGAGNGIFVEALAQKGNFTMQKMNSSLANYEEETSNNVGCSRPTDILSPMGRKMVESSSRDEVSSVEKMTAMKTDDALKAKRKGVAESKKAFDWDSLRKQVNGNSAPKERSPDTMDSLDWEAVRCAEVDDIAHTIRERGMNNMLAERIKDFLNRLVKDHGSIDLEWLRDVQPDKAKDYLLSVRGLGLKSVECVRLLSLQNLAFPVDTNVGRICVRLGWVPLQPLPESLQLHLLELYPVLESIQKYLWPRLCKLDQRTLYELHYQLITFGKVFCTKSRPNCNACPMRGECKHFASAFASARLALPGPEEKSLISSVAPIMAEPDHNRVISPKLLSPPSAPEGNLHVQAYSGITRCEPIIEEPATPDYIQSSESAIEDIEDTPYAVDDAPCEHPDEIPTIKLNLEELTLHVQNYIQENKMELQDGDMSQALVTLTPEAASIPVPKLKNVNRLRTEHRVYELPDTHPLLKGLDPREPDDPCSYLLAIWTPGETAESIEPPKTGCDNQASGDLCDKETCFACNSIREANAQTVRGTLLIPCRTAMRGSFPLNGTYFQVNEVFADHDSSVTPIDVPREWIWNLPRRTVFFGTSIPTIFRGLTTEGIQYCFWRGFVCVRGFDRIKRAPRPLLARLHFPASKLTRPRKGSTQEEV